MNELKKIIYYYSFIYLFIVFLFYFFIHLFIHFNSPGSGNQLPPDQNYRKITFIYWTI